MKNNRFQPAPEDAMSRRIANLSIHPEDRDGVPEEGARSPVGMYGDKGQAERLLNAKRQGAGGRSPTATTARWPGNSLPAVFAKRLRGCMRLQSSMSATARRFQLDK